MSGGRPEWIDHGMSGQVRQKIANVTQRGKRTRRRVRRSADNERHDNHKTSSASYSKDNRSVDRMTEEKRGLREAEVGESDFCLISRST